MVNEAKSVIVGGGASTEQCLPRSGRCDRPGVAASRRPGRGMIEVGARAW